MEKVFMAVLGIPATSSAIERVFSHSGMATLQRRSQAQLLLLNHQLVPYINSHLYKLS